MCFGTKGLQRVPWQSHGLVEDMEYSWTVRIAGYKVAFLPDVQVRGLMLARGGKAAASQRQRWERGRQELRRRMLLPLLMSRHLGWYQKLASPLELTVPPSMFSCLFFVTLFLANLLVCLSTPASLTVQTFFAVWSLTMTLAVLAHALARFVVFGLPWSYLLLVPYVPFYAVRKFLVSLRGTPKAWVRTARESRQAVSSPPGEKLNHAFFAAIAVLKVEILGFFLADRVPASIRSWSKHSNSDEA